MANYTSKCELKVGDTYTRTANIDSVGGNSSVYTLRLVVTLVSQNIGKNTSKVKITSSIRTNGEKWGWYEHPYINIARYIRANDEKSYGSAKNTTKVADLEQYNSGNWVTIGSWSGDVSHDSSGKCVIYAKEKLNTGTSYTYIPVTTTLESHEITLNPLHTAPTITIPNLSGSNYFAITEENLKLPKTPYITPYGGNYLFVPYLSKKKIKFKVKTFDSATISSVKLITLSDNTTYEITGYAKDIIGEQEFECTIDIGNLKEWTGNESNDIQGALSLYVKDSMGSERAVDVFEEIFDDGSYSDFTYIIINYFLPTIAENECVLNRDSVTTTKCILSTKGVYCNSIEDLPNNAEVYYKYWSADESEPETENVWIQIPSSYIITNGNNFSITDWAITKDGNTVEFLDNKEYNFKIKLVDSYDKEYVTNNLTLPSTEYVWAEIPELDLVDFNKVSVGGNDLIEHTDQGLNITADSLLLNGSEIKPATSVSLSVATTVLRNGYSTSENTATWRDDYIGIYIRVLPVSGNSFATAFIPRSVLTSSYVDYIVSDDDNYVSFSIKVSGSTFYIKTKGRSQSTGSIVVYGVRLTATLS